MLGSGPIETTSAKEIVASEGDTPKVMSMEVPTNMPIVPRLPSMKPTPTREVPKLKKYKKNYMMPLRESLRKHAAT